MPHSKPCPDPALLEQFLLGQIGAPKAGTLESHLLECDACTALLEQRAAVDPLLQTVRRGAAYPGIGTVIGIDDAVRRAAALYRPAPGQEFPFLDPPQAPGELGRLAHYRVLRLLGRGGMGLVFEAEDSLLQRPVALKVLHPRWQPDEDLNERLLREARALIAVRHEHLVTLYHAGKTDRVVFLALELLHGDTLEQWLQAHGPADLDRTVRWGLDIAAALGALHARGLVHRDVKPGNLWVGAPGERIKLLDLGLARPVSPAPGLTPDGYVLGTPGYLSPEQARGEAATASSDLFSLGCVLYRLAAGAAAFPGSGTLPVQALLSGRRPRPMRRVNPDVPPALDTLIEELLAQDPARRPASAQEVGRRLAALEGDQSWAEQARAIIHRRRPVLVALLVGALLAAGLWLGRAYWWAASSEPPSATGPELPIAPEGAVSRGRHPDGRPLRMDFALRVQPLGGQISANGQLELRLKDHIAFQAEVERDAHVGVFVIDDQGQVLMLFPNQHEEDDLLQAGRSRTIPGSRRYWIEAKTASNGPEFVHVFAATRPWKAPPGHRGPDDVYTTYPTPAAREQLQLTLRSLALVAPDPAAENLVAEVILPFQVRPPR